MNGISLEKIAFELLFVAYLMTLGIGIYIFVIGMKRLLAEI